MGGAVGVCEGRDGGRPAGFGPIAGTGRFNSVGDIMISLENIGPPTTPRYHVTVPTMIVLVLTLTRLSLDSPWALVCALRWLRRRWIWFTRARGAGR